MTLVAGDQVLRSTGDGGSKDGSVVGVCGEVYASGGFDYFCQAADLPDESACLVRGESVFKVWVAADSAQFSQLPLRTDQCEVP